jgi:hypothetical protein
MLSSALGLRVAAVLSGIWAGLLIGIGAIGTPAAFALVAPEVAGRIAGHMFVREAYLSLFVALVLLVMLRPHAQDEAEAGRGSVLNTDMLLVFGAAFCTVLGYFAIQPMMPAARSGQGPLSFGALHGISFGLYGLKGLIAIALTWRLAQKR